MGNLRRATAGRELTMDAQRGGHGVGRAQLGVGANAVAVVTSGSLKELFSASQVQEGCRWLLAHSRVGVLLARCGACAHTHCTRSDWHQPLPTSFPPSSLRGCYH